LTLVGRQTRGHVIPHLDASYPRASVAFSDLQQHFACLLTSDVSQPYLQMALNNYLLALNKCKYMMLQFIIMYHNKRCFHLAN